MWTLSSQSSLTQSTSRLHALPSGCAPQAFAITLQSPEMQSSGRAHPIWPSARGPQAAATSFE
jgi:hypothetical protein